MFVGQTRLTDVLFSHCSAGTNGGAIAAVSTDGLRLNTSSIELVDCAFDHCIAYTGNGGMVLWQVSGDGSLAMTLAQSSGQAPQGGGGGLFVDIASIPLTALPDVNITVNGQATVLGLTNSSQRYGDTSALPAWTSTIGTATALFGDVIATTPSRLVLMCVDAEGVWSRCDNSTAMTQSYVSTSVAVRVLDGFGQWMTAPLPQSACSLSVVGSSGGGGSGGSSSSAAATLQGNVAAIVGGVSTFPTVALSGVRQRAYPVSLMCFIPSAPGGELTLLEPATFLIQVPPCAVNHEPQGDGVNCQPCGENLVSLDGLGCVCAVGYYLDPLKSAESGFRDCVQCGEGTNCSRPGVTLGTLPLLPDYWRSSNASSDIRPCLSRGACLWHVDDVVDDGAASGQRGSERRRLIGTAGAAAGSPCAVNRTGPLCAVRVPHGRVLCTTLNLTECVTGVLLCLDVRT